VSIPIVSTGRIGIVGDSAIDLTFVLGPAAGEKVEPVRSLRSVGGTGANAAAAAVRLGSAVRLASVVGEDLFRLLGTGFAPRARSRG